MKKQQVVLIGSGVILLLLLSIFGKTVPSGEPVPRPAATSAATQFDFSVFLQQAKKNLSPAQQAFVNSLEVSVVRGDVKSQQIKVYNQLAQFWKDSASQAEPYAFYTAQASKLENSEKSLNFAAQLFLDNCRGASDEGMRSWMAGEARDLFQRSLQLNPSNDSAKIGLGSSYIFGSPAGDPTQVMQGIQQILEVARRDSTNLYAQLMLGIGGVVSGQLDRAVERLQKVVAHDPSNVEALLTLADAYERKGDKVKAAQWYEASKQLIRNPVIIKEIDEHLKTLK
ncbi:MAG: tetratricopeptide repeat protein [Williamsia sp.]|nr:tetratricopeptide repeat protein [Williamsia sp.]